MTILELIDVHSAISLTRRRPLQPSTGCVVPRDDDVTRGTWRCNHDTTDSVYLALPIGQPHYELNSSIYLHVCPIKVCNVATEGHKSNFHATSDTQVCRMTGEAMSKSRGQRLKVIVTGPRI